jgi:hypothetical protein
MSQHPSLAGPRAKIGRGKDHLMQLHAAMDSWELAESKDHSVAVEFHYERQSLDIRTNKPKPIDPSWPLIIGDVVHNLRSALDHLACQLAILNGNPLTCCEKTVFPVSETESFFRDIKHKIEPFVSAEAFEVIKECQPYYAAQLQGQVATNHTLWILHKLDIIDKHRVLIVVAKQIRPAVFRAILGNQAVDLPIERRFWQPLEDGAHLARLNFIDFPYEVEGKMRVELLTEVKIQLANTELVCDGVNVEDALLPIVRFVTDIVDTFGRRFFGE